MVDHDTTLTRSWFEPPAHQSSLWRQLTKCKHGPCTRGYSGNSFTVMYGKQYCDLGQRYAFLKDIFGMKGHEVCDLLQKIKKPDTVCQKWSVQWSWCTHGCTSHEGILPNTQWLKGTVVCSDSCLRGVGPGLGWSRLHFPWPDSMQAAFRWASKLGPLAHIPVAGAEQACRTHKHTGSLTGQHSPWRSSRPAEWVNRLCPQRKQLQTHMARSTVGYGGEWRGEWP